ncbi:MAG: ribonucleotide reductase [Streptococcaceae bacterium]|jgi:transcriptional regulator NrdR family protein|nr:ribonucleotide reductase [Streptococcaceae bacterium]
MQGKLVDKVVIKRNGRAVDWDSFRIQSAVFRAAIFGKYKNDPLRANMLANNVTRIVEKAIAQLPFEKIEIDAINNQVLKQLRDFDEDVAQDFLAYKTQQELRRQEKPQNKRPDFES